MCSLVAVALHWGSLGAVLEKPPVPPSEDGGPAGLGSPGDAEVQPALKTTPVAPALGPKNTHCNMLPGSFLPPGFEAGAGGGPCSVPLESRLRAPAGLTAWLLRLSYSG